MPFQPTATDLPSRKERHQQSACPGLTSPTKRLCGAVIVTSLLAGCAVGPDYMGPPRVTLPTQWANAPRHQRGTGEFGRWWFRLRDSLLTQLIGEAVEANPSLAKAKASVREARATVAQTASGLFPSVTGSGSVTDNKTSSAGSSGVAIGTSPYTLYQAGFDASWELDLLGGTQRNIEAAIRSEQSAEDELRYSLVTLLGDVAAYYVDARGYQARIALARRTAASQRDTERLTRTKYEAGSATAVDLAKASAQAASTEANIPTYEAALAADTHRLGILLGRAPTAVSGLFAKSAPVPAPRMPLPTGVPADLLTNRSDVASAERKLAQATAKIGAAEADRYPSISLTGSVGTSAIRAGDLAKYSSVSWSVGPSITVPVFDAGKRYATVRIAEAQRDQAFATFHSTLLSALEDVENALVALSREKARAGKLAEAAKNYREAARLSRSLFETGSSNFLDVLDAERSLYSAEDSLIQSQVAIAKYYVTLAKALGGGWVDPVDAATPLIVDANTGPHAREALR
ncbi:efflux transporter outer membrane subunit [Bradyrhizobium diazoefficiens]|nr:efflux transporter outer membrane subunit [Bradyrhizobium diazoefficiens]MCD9292853.1 efflux transporter outer membrane subunit [Bradyrhizobium diazoefficiens]MCD9808187.1 efflux transporter outer membrane subunit [Bradyrhizobium diazoefficiens]MCD9826533.1 efflux transporter outer membrane subunit [Bradyrhizobium diazoefficiens]MCD9845508.1 efflux transporter outer membrane subunit [Bradyrhizobium diazoefficiens]MCD9881790.1 efflux transporter outer membrane subunit [Bradyrhizobium diazoef